MPIHPALLRRAIEARVAQPTRIRLPRSGHYSSDPVQLRRQVQDLERSVAENQDRLARESEE